MDRSQGSLFPSLDRVPFVFSKKILSLSERIVIVRHKMFRTLRYLLLPTAVFLTIAGLAWGEWHKVIRLKRVAEDFHQNSEIRLFKNAGERQWQGRPFPTYEYELLGEMKEFTTHTPIELPADGRVRIGLDPIPRTVTPFIELPQRGEVVIPINGPDTVDTVYRGFRGHDISEDVTKASVVSAAAFIAGIAGFFLQRIIFRDVGRAFRSR
jgi:hypothetical protein